MFALILCLTWRIRMSRLDGPRRKVELRLRNFNVIQTTAGGSCCSWGTLVRWRSGVKAALTKPSQCLLRLLLLARALCCDPSTHPPTASPSFCSRRLSSILSHLSPLPITPPSCFLPHLHSPSISCHHPSSAFCSSPLPIVFSPLHWPCNWCLSKRS